LLLKAPSIVVLDEATAHLDTESEVAVQRALDETMKGRTAIVVAHRLRTVGRVDHIMILEDGRIAELGRRVDLIQDPSSRFSALLRVGLEEVLA